MSKEKIFKPEDFDKPKDKTLWQKYKKRIIIAATLIVVVTVVLGCIFCGKDKQKEETANDKGNTEQVSVFPETPVTTTETECVETETTDEPQTVVKMEPETNPVPVAENPKPEVNQEVVTPTNAAQSLNISDNVEQEAMNVIRGNYGNVPERRQKLGSKFQEIQNRVNQLKKQGAF